MAKITVKYVVPYQQFPFFQSQTRKVCTVCVRTNKGNFDELVRRIAQAKDGSAPTNYDFLDTKTSEHMIDSPANASMAQ